MPPVKDPFVRVHSLMKQGRLSTALRMLLNSETNMINDAFRLDKNHAWYCVGDIFFRQKNFEAAKNAFKRSVDYRPDDEDALEAVGNCYDELKRPKLAERYFRRALDVSTHTIKASERAAITFNLANALFDQGRLDEAIELYKQLTTGHVSIRKSAKKNLALAENRKSRSRPSRGS